MKKTLLILSALLLLVVLSVGATVSVSAADMTHSGTWGNLSWTLNKTTGELTISGTGGMDDDPSPFTWLAYKTSIQSVTIEDGVTSIGDGAFYGCKGLTSITIPNSVTSIGSYAFEGCKGLTSITIPDSMTSIGEEAFYGCSGLSSITIPDSVTSIGDYAFNGCKGLTSVTIENGVTSIGRYAFSGCTGLTSITIGNGVTSIGYGAFMDCTGLTSITIPDSVTSIGSIAFHGCYRLVEVYNLSRLNIKGSSSHADYYALVIHTSKNVPSKLWTDADGYVFYEDGGDCHLIDYTGTETALTLPANCHGKNYKINQYAFRGCTELTSITIPDSVTSIGDDAFYNCTGLSSITIPNSVTSIGDAAFYGCTGLTSITIPDSVTSIGYGAFSGCANITTVHFCGTETNWNQMVSRLDLPNSNYTLTYFHFDEGIITIPPSHISEGVKIYTCSVCGETKMGTVKKLAGHTYGDWEKHNAEQHKKVCACGDVQTADHAWDEGEITTDPTHLAEGVKTYTCSICGETKTETLEKLTDHTWNEGEITTDPTHLAEGVKTYTCDCGASKTESVAKITEHTYGGWINQNLVVHKGTCECGDTTIVEHAWNNGDIMIEPSHEQTGIKIFTCPDCGASKQTVLAKLPSDDTTPDSNVPTEGATNESTVPTDDTTDSNVPTDDATTDGNTSNSSAAGCGASLTGGLTVLFLLLGMGCTVLRKRKNEI